VPRSTSSAGNTNFTSLSISEIFFIEILESDTLKEVIGILMLFFEENIGINEKLKTKSPIKIIFVGTCKYESEPFKAEKKKKHIINLIQFNF
jgi:hypothetical protein